MCRANRQLLVTLRQVGWLSVRYGYVLATRAAGLTHEGQMGSLGMGERCRPTLIQHCSKRGGCETSTRRGTRKDVAAAAMSSLSVCQLSHRSHHRTYTLAGGGTMVGRGQQV